jgi:hypothetical protein
MRKNLSDILQREHRHHPACTTRAVLPLVPQHLDEDVCLNPLEDIGEDDNVPDTTSFTNYVTEFWVKDTAFYGTTTRPRDPTPPTTWKAGTTISRRKFTMPIQTST